MALTIRITSTARRPRPCLSRQEIHTRLGYEFKKALARNPVRVFEFAPPGPSLSQTPKRQDLQEWKSLKRKKKQFIQLRSSDTSIESESPAHIGHIFRAVLPRGTEPTSVARCVESQDVFQ